MRERDIEAYLKQQVEALGGEIRKVTWIGRRGAPDRVVMFRGQTWWVELKAPGKTPEPHQEREHKRMQAMGQSVFVIDSKEMVDLLLMPYALSNETRMTVCSYTNREGKVVHHSVIKNI